MVKLTSQQIHFFDTFGYIVLPRLMADSIDWITEEFKAVFTDRGIIHDGSKRSCIVPFIDQRTRLCTLLDDPRIAGLAASLLGDDFNYLNGDGNYYTGDTPWHSDGFHEVGKFLKIAFYLDPVQKESGALRVIPGSHRIDLLGKWDATKSLKSKELWDIEMQDVPSIALESNPGDVVAFNHNIMHAAFGGNSVRRMFTLNLCQHVETADEITDMKSYIDAHAGWGSDTLHSELMRETATAERMMHLQQVIDHEGNLPGLVAKVRQEKAVSGIA